MVKNDKYLNLSVGVLSDANDVNKFKRDTYASSLVKID